MQPLVEQFGSEKEAMVAINRAAQHLSPEALRAGTVIRVAGQNVWVQGRVVDGVARVGSASMRMRP
jgi:hypothetical protein